MVCAPVRSIIPSLKLGDYLSVQAHNSCSIYHIDYSVTRPNYASLISGCIYINLFQTSKSGLVEATHRADKISRIAFPTIFILFTVIFICVCSLA